MTSIDSMEPIDSMDCTADQYKNISDGYCYNKNTFPIDSIFGCFGNTEKSTMTGKKYCISKDCMGQLKISENNPSHTLTTECSVPRLYAFEKIISVNPDKNSCAVYNEVCDQSSTQKSVGGLLFFLILLLVIFFIVFIVYFENIQKKIREITATLEKNSIFEPRS